MALATDDIIHTVTALRDRGVEFLSVPTSYYDDLQVRVGKIDEPVDVLAQLGILVDRDPDGYLLRFPSQAASRRVSRSSSERAHAASARETQGLVGHRAREGSGRKSCDDRSHTRSMSRRVTSRSASRTGASTRRSLWAGASPNCGTLTTCTADAESQRGLREVSGGDDDNALRHRTRPGRSRRAEAQLATERICQPRLVDVVVEPDEQDATSIECAVFERDGQGPACSSRSTGDLPLHRDYLIIHRASAPLQAR